MNGKISIRIKTPPFVLSRVEASERVFQHNLPGYSMGINSNRHRLVLIALAGISLLTGLWAGLARMGWLLPIPNSQFVLVHGPLMAVGFLGTLIGLERAVALKRWW